MGSVVGQMRERIRIASYTVTRNGFHEEEKAWSFTGPLWAKMEVKEVGTDNESSSFQHGISTRTLFTIHHRSVSQTNEIEWRGLRYLIEGIIPDTRRQFLTLKTRQINPA